MDYILKANLVLLLFFLFYQLLLKRHTFFNANRWFLLAGLAISVLIPLVTISNCIYYEPVTFNSNANINLLFAEATVRDSPESFNYISWLFDAYIAGVAFFFIKLLLDIKSLFNLISNSETAQNTSFKLILNEQNTAPFSFFNWIVVNPKQFDNKELDLVLQHEVVHVKERHSIDMMLSQLYAIVFWFNPITWFYKQALQQNLEFIADQKVHDQSAHQHLYQKLLLKTSIPNQELAFTTTFYNSTIKKRIVMLHKPKSKQIFKLQFILIIPVLAVFLLSMNTKDIYVPLEVEYPVNDTTSNAKDIKIIFTKDMSDKTLKSIKEDLKDNNILMIIKIISRNNDAEIIEIDIDFETANGSANYMRGNPNGIIPFYFEMNSSDGSFGVGTVSINLTEDEIIKINNLVDQQIESFLAQTGGTLEELLKFYKKNSLAELREEMIEINKNMYKVGNLKNKTLIEKDSIWVNSFSKSFNTQANDTIVINHPLKTKTFTTNLVSGNIIEKAPNYSLYIKDHLKEVGFMDKINDDINASNTNFNPNQISRNDGIVFYINGKIASLEQLQSLEPHNIESVTVIKDKKELKKLNHADKDGVIQIVLKNQKKYSINPVGVSKIESKPKYETDPTKSFMFYEELMKSKLLSNIKFDDIDASLSNLKMHYYITKYDTIVITQNGSLISRAEFDKINANDIQSIEVIKDPKRLSKLGYPDKREMIVLKTDALSNHLALKPKNTVTYHKVNSVSYKYNDDTNDSNNGITHYIYKETTDEELNLQIKKFKEFGVTMSYSKLKRNKNGDITNIKVMLQNDAGQEIEDTFSEKNGAVVMEYGLSNGKLKISKLTE